MVIINNYGSQKSDVRLFSNCTTLLKIYFEISSKFFRAEGLFVCFFQEAHKITIFSIQEKYLW